MTRLQKRDLPPWCLQLSTSAPADYPIFRGKSGHHELTA